MCHFYSLRQPLARIPRGHRYSWQQWCRYRLAPGEQGQMLRKPSGTVDVTTWGFRSRATDLRGKPLIRGEIAAERPMTANAFRKQRCLVFADGFYIGSGKGTAPRYFFFQRPDAEPFAFAGIWTSYAVGRDDIESFAILTCPANATVGNVHERMPVILGAGFHDAWLDDAYSDVAALTHMLRPWSDRLLEGWEVRSDLGVRQDMEYDMADPVGPKLRATKRPGTGMFTVT